MARAFQDLQVRVPQLTAGLDTLHRPGRMAQRREGHQALAAEPAVGRLPDLRRRPAIARRAQLHDVGHAHFLVVQPDLHAGNAPRALANGEDGGEPGVQLVGVLVEAVLQRLALGDEVLHRAQRDEVEARCGSVGEPRALDAGTEALDQPQPLPPGRQLLAPALEAHLPASTPDAAGGVPRGRAAR